MQDFKKRGGFGGGGSRGNGGNGGYGGDRRDGGKSFGGGGGKSFGGDRSKFGRPGNKDFRQTQMFSTTCAECHKPCEVPFRPTGDRPVYCNYCFGKNKTAGGGNYQKRDDRPSPVAPAPVRPQVDNGILIDLKKQIDAVNAKLDQVMEFMQKPEKTSKKKVAAKKK
jgi:CxxC-x17-CxxC domain-containing protein